jgi:hypothetical protein
VGSHQEIINQFITFYKKEEGVMIDALFFIAYFLVLGASFVAPAGLLF